MTKNIQMTSIYRKLVGTRGQNYSKASNIFGSLSHKLHRLKHIFNVVSGGGIYILAFTEPQNKTGQLRSYLMDILDSPNCSGVQVK